MNKSIDEIPSQGMFGEYLNSFVPHKLQRRDVCFIGLDRRQRQSSAACIVLREWVTMTSLAPSPGTQFVRLLRRNKARLKKSPPYQPSRACLNLVCKNTFAMERPHPLYFDHPRHEATPQRPWGYPSTHMRPAQKRVLLPSVRGNRQEDLERPRQDLLFRATFFFLCSHFLARTASPFASA